MQCAATYASVFVFVVAVDVVVRLSIDAWVLIMLAYYSLQWPAQVRRRRQCRPPLLLHRR